MERIIVFAAAASSAWLIVTLFAKEGADRWAKKILGFLPIAFSLYWAIRNTHNLIATNCMFFPDPRRRWHLMDFCPPPDTWMFYVSIPVPYILFSLPFLAGLVFLRDWGSASTPGGASRPRRGAL